MPPEPAVGTPGQPAPDLAVETVPLPPGHVDVAGERVEQADVLLGGVPDLPVEAAHRDAGEQAAARYLGPLVRQVGGLQEGPPARQALADLVVHILDLAEERVTGRGHNMRGGPER